MSLRTCLTDLRGKSGWTLAQRKRKADLGLVSPTWTLNPLGFVPLVGPHTAPGWLEYDGALTDPIYADTKAVADRYPFPDNKPLVLWQSGLQKLLALNLAAPGCAEAYAEVLTGHCAWADLVCFDYYSTPGDPLLLYRGSLPAWATGAWFDDFRAGLRMLANSVRRARPDWRVYAYDWNWHFASSALDGIFVEDRYTRNQPIAETLALAKRIGAERGVESDDGPSPPPCDVILEMRVPASFTAQRTAEIEEACVRNGWALSRGKDQTAVGG